jgi:hypothetical protein
MDTPFLTISLVIVALISFALFPPSLIGILGALAVLFIYKSITGE